MESLILIFGSSLKKRKLFLSFMAISWCYFLFLMSFLIKKNSSCFSWLGKPDSFLQTPYLKGAIQCPRNELSFSDMEFPLLLYSFVFHFNSIFLFLFWFETRKESRGEFLPWLEEHYFPLDFPIPFKCQKVIIPKLRRPFKITCHKWVSLKEKWAGFLL